MGFFNKFLTSRAAPPPTRAFQVLTFAPSVLRMSVAGKDATRELDALADAVEKLGFPQGFSTERVFATASEVVRLIKIDGIAGLTDRMRAELSDDEKSDAMRLALVAVFTSSQRDSNDFGILAGMAEHIGMTKAEFEALHEAAKVFG